ncbi:unnamed protein product [Rotaria socialis]|uniref:Dual serine/threonine and tyrosine protein kinase n=1 Tax=Rotaria socialis TaxID=392032 RepID=A0A817VJL7_9BILA|nr:unnamed protein product [Rotaria socialis]CAF3343977.1 unnamed protein product [Rotaria socialis]CAF3623139.1 unnamed protein product [Rotaria socialis]
MTTKSRPITLKSNAGKLSPSLSVNNTSLPAHSSTLSQQFADIIRRYKYHLQHIQRLLKETDKSYDEINETRVLTSDKISTMQISKSDREYLDALKTRPLALIICSQTYSGKSRFVNELLNETLLPESPHINKNDVVRMVRIKNHATQGASLNIAGSFEWIDADIMYKPVSWTSVPREDLVVNGANNCRSLMDTDNVTDDFEQQETATLEIRKPLDLLNDDLQIVVTPSNQKLNMKQIYTQITENIVPIFIYIIDQEILSANDIDELRFFRSIVPNEPILFIRIDQSDNASSTSETPCVQTFRQLCDLGFLSFLSTETTDNTSDTTPLFQSDMIDNGLINFTHFLNYILKHIDRLMIRAVSILQRSHEICLDLFNDSAFDMARDILVTPKRLSYAREKEKNLYESLVALTNSKQNEIQKLILQAVDEMHEVLTDEACSLEIPGIELTDQLTVKHARDLKKCTSVIQEQILVRLNEIIANKLLDSINVLHDNYVGTLTRCLISLESSRDDDEAELSASKALQEILHSAYEVNLSLPTNSNLFQILIDRMKELFRTFSWHNFPRIDPEFKRSVALNMLNSLSEAKLAKSVCSQLNDRIRMSHDNFETLLKQLDHRHTDRLKSTEDKQQRVRKDCTPRIARLLLESTSLKDLIQYGLPKQGREIGRGQYGVVYDCKNWANHQSCVLKSVVPPDDRHWNDLALEFHYLRRIPEHPRIVQLIGSVIDYSDSDQTPVLLIMERLKRDLYGALKSRLEFSIRMHIALDVVEGLRYLHGLGLVHRDIKLKNVLLDEANRARITDLGFCKPEVMMSGSLVGTPIHMAPELFTSKYDHTVDVYAFGILFWYICSNGVKLPTNFDVCSSKDILWSAVKKGVRPERLMDFSDECWEIMTKCWDTEPSRRPYLGEVQENIEQILNTTRTTTTA